MSEGWERGPSVHSRHGSFLTRPRELSTPEARRVAPKAQGVDQRRRVPSYNHRALMRSCDPPEPPDWPNQVCAVSRYPTRDHCWSLAFSRHVLLAELINDLRLIVGQDPL